MYDQWKDRLRRLTDPVARRLANKLILLFTIIIILVVSSLTFISYRMLRSESVGGIMSSTGNNLLLVGKNLESYLEGIEQLSLPQISYDEFNYALQHESEEYGSRMYVEDYLKNLYYSRSDLEAIYLHINKENKYYYVTKESYNVDVRILPHAPLDGLSWYDRALQSPYNRSFQSLLEEREDGDYEPPNEAGVIGYHRVLRSIVTREPIGVLTFYFNSSAMDHILRDIPFSEGQHLLALGPDNEPYAADDPGFYRESKEAGMLEQLQAGSGRFTWNEGSGNYLVIYDVGSSAGWKLVKPIPYSQINEAATTARRLSMAIGGVFLLISIGLVGFTSTTITKPLKQLSRQMSHFSKGGFDAEAPVRGRDEIAYLSRHFNKMVQETNELINERYKMKIVEKNAVLKALEAEINPHFLYNALQAISTKALKSGNEDVVEMVDDLAMTLRYCISGKDVVPAGDELTHVARYLSLQKARFGSRMSVHFDWPEELKEIGMPKLSLQTLVENAIKHGLERVSRPVAIAITARTEGGETHITVLDDGPGFQPGRLEEVRASLLKPWEEPEPQEEHRSGEGIGLRNLHTRLRLLYGDRAGLELAETEHGTAMTMILPKGGGPYV